MSALSRAMNVRTQLWSMVVAAVTVSASIAACNRGGEDGTPSDVPPTWAQARTTPGHKAHLGKKVKKEGGEERSLVCADCHGQDSKNFTAKTEPCSKCHQPEEDQHHLGSKEKPTACVTCHVFQKSDGGGVTPVCVDCHKPGGNADKASKGHHNTNDATCTSCHAVHGKPKIAIADCTNCHTGIGVRHGNRFVTATNSDAGVDAIASVSWEAGTALREAGIAAGPFSLNPANAVVPSGVEVEQLAESKAGVCSGCHVPHSAGKDANDTCQNCHVSTSAQKAPELAWLAKQAPKVKPSGPGVAGHKACTVCHTPHQAAKDLVKPCVGCHEPKKAVTQIKGHAECKGCHTPHAPLEALNACATCHKNHPALGTPKVAQHEKCSSCHDVHTPTASPAAACEKCHAAVHPNHPAALAKSGKSACVGCHTPHPSASNVIVRPCSSCHQNIATSDSKAHATVVCGTCHKKHEGFKLAGLGAPFCKTCHGPVGAKVSKGHSECKSCHGGPHNPVRQVVCSKCHEAEATTAYKGHASCPTCHEPHSGKLSVGGGKTGAAFCVTCHTNKPSTPHGSLPTGCQTCHRQHGPKGVASPPACLSCHSMEKLTGLHKGKTHSQNCTSCHGGHSAPRSDRTTCTATCHTKQKTHQPDAVNCKGCHNFKI